MVLIMPTAGTMIHFSMILGTTIRFITVDTMATTVHGVAAGTVLISLGDSAGMILITPGDGLTTITVMEATGETRTTRITPATIQAIISTVIVGHPTAMLPVRTDLLQEPGFHPMEVRV